MENTIFAGLSRQVALRDQMDIIANNIANMSTPGFRAQNMVFTEYLAEAEGRPKPDVKDPLSMVLNYGHFQDSRPGPLRQTGNPLDVAIEGPGFFAIQTPDGGTGYTRAGNFQINARGEIVTGTGQPVLSEGGGPITIPEGTREVNIAADGFVSTEDGEIARLKVAEFENIQDLEAAGNGLYVTDAPEQPALNTKVMQGMIEDSNVQPIIEMTRMIDVLRSYQQTQKILETEHERQRAMVQRLTRNG